MKKRILVTFLATTLSSNITLADYTERELHFLERIYNIQPEGTVVTPNSGTSITYIYKNKGKIAKLRKSIPLDTFLKKSLLSIKETEDPNNERIITINIDLTSKGLLAFDNLEVDALNNRLDELKNDLATLKASEKSKMTSRDKLKKIKDTADNAKKYQAAISKVEEIRKQIRTKTLEILEAKKDIASLKKANHENHLTRTKNTAQLTLVQLHKKELEAQRAITKEKHAHTTLFIEATNQKITALQLQTNKIEAQKDKLQQQVGAKKSTRETLKTELETAAAEKRDSLKTKIAELLTSMEELKALITEANATLEQLKAQKKELSDKNKRKKDDKRAYQDRLTKFQQKITEATEHLNVVRAREAGPADDEDNESNADEDQFGHHGPNPIELEKAHHFNPRASFTPNAEMYQDPLVAQLDKNLRLPNVPLDEIRDLYNQTLIMENEVGFIHEVATNRNKEFTVRYGHEVLKLQKARHHANGKLHVSILIQVDTGKRDQLARNEALKINDYNNFGAINDMLNQQDIKINDDKHTKKITITHPRGQDTFTVLERTALDQDQLGIIQANEVLVDDEYYGRTIFYRDQTNAVILSKKQGMVTLNKLLNLAEEGRQWVIANPEDRNVPRSAKIYLGLKNLIGRLKEAEQQAFNHHRRLEAAGASQDVIAQAQANLEAAANSTARIIATLAAQANHCGPGISGKIDLLSADIRLKNEYKGPQDELSSKIALDLAQLRKDTLVNFCLVKDVRRDNPLDLPNIHTAAHVLQGLRETHGLFGIEESNAEDEHVTEIQIRQRVTHAREYFPHHYTIAAMVKKLRDEYNDESNDNNYPHLITLWLESLNLNIETFYDDKLELKDELFFFILFVKGYIR